MNAEPMGRPIMIVTGSAGLIGTKLVEALAADYRVIGLDLMPPREEAPGTDFARCDMTKDESITNALAFVRDRYGDRLASVLHLAAYYDFSGKPSPLYRT